MPACHDDIPDPADIFLDTEALAERYGIGTTKAKELVRSGDLPTTVVAGMVRIPLAALALWITVGVFRQGVWSRPDGIVVRNVFRRYRAPWSDVQDIERPPPYGKLGNAGLQIVLANGERISAALYASGPFNSPTHADAVVEALRSDLQRYGRTGSGPPDTTG
jgi:hypothetical protein